MILIHPSLSTYAPKTKAPVVSTKIKTANFYLTEKSCSVVVLSVLPRTCVHSHLCAVSSR